MKTIALVNQKGGVAKTTSTYNLAAAKAKLGSRVLMVDLDPQSSLTISCGYEPSDELNCLVQLMKKNRDCKVTECIYPVENAELDNLFILPSDILLAENEWDLITLTGREHYLEAILKEVEDYFDYCFIDCPPYLGMLTYNGLCAANEVIVPCKPEYLGYRGLKFILSTIEKVQNDKFFNPDLNLLGILLTIKENNKENNVIAEFIAQNYNVIGEIKKKSVTNNGATIGKPVTLTNPSSDVAREYYRIADML